MRKTLALGVAFLLAGAAGAAFAGDSGFSCANGCPLAKQANERRSYGNETASSKATPAAQVQKNLSKI